MGHSGELDSISSSTLAQVLDSLTQHSFGVCPTNKCWSEIHSFSSVFGLRHLLLEISGSLAPEPSTMSTSLSLNFVNARLPQQQTSAAEQPYKSTEGESKQLRCDSDNQKQ